MKKSPPTKVAKELRRLAEDRLVKGEKSPVLDTFAVRNVHELQVYQIELEMQNAELKEARDRMEELLENYTDLYDFAPVGYFSLNAEGHILEANLTGATLLRVERSLLINTTLARYAEPASRSVFTAFLKRVFAESGQLDCEVALMRDDGRPCWVRFRGTAAHSASGPQSWCRVTVSEITAIKEAEEILQRNETLFSSLIEHAPVGVYVVDDQFLMHQINSKARPVFTNVDPLVGRDFSEIMKTIWSAEAADEVLMRFRDTLKTGKAYRSPAFTERRRDIEETQVFDWQLQRIMLPAGNHGVVCFFEDITERKRIESAKQRLLVLAASNRKLEREVERRQASEAALKKSQRHERQMLKEALQMQMEMRHLARQVLQVQEQERKRISRELHDHVVQTLVGINVHLAGLTKEASVITGSLEAKIASTQHLVDKSVDIVHRFARDLRPTMLDDVGLIPTLQSYLKSFMERSGLRVSLTAFKEVEKLSSDDRTVLYRIVQESLTNIVRHAKATRVKISIRKEASGVCMEISDDGQGFTPPKKGSARRTKRLGLIGMRERVEMVGGSFHIDSAPQHGTKVCLTIPERIKRTKKPKGAAR